LFRCEYCCLKQWSVFTRAITFSTVHQVLLLLGFQVSYHLPHPLFLFRSSSANQTHAFYASHNRSKISVFFFSVSLEIWYSLSAQFYHEVWLWQVKKSFK
jgi:hypothetical protein